MRKKVREMEEALRLRRNGLSYRKILEKLKVSKSSLSVWLKDSPLTEREKRLLHDRNKGNISKGRIRAAAVHRDQRLERERLLFSEAKQEFARYKLDPFFVLGVSLYWAEGVKRWSSYAFVNSDYEMMQLMVSWMESFLGIDRRTMNARLYIHKLYAHERCEEFWAKQTGIPLENFRQTIYKPSGLGVKKRPDYKGCLRVMGGGVKALRKMLFWQRLLFGEFKSRL